MLNADEVAQDLSECTTHLVAIHGPNMVGFGTQRLVDPLIHVPQAPLVGLLAVATTSPIFGVLRHRSGRHDPQTASTMAGTLATVPSLTTLIIQSRQSPIELRGTTTML